MTVDHVARARRHLTYGYYRPAVAGGAPYVVCPDCSRGVATAVVAWAKPSAIRRAKLQDWLTRNGARGLGDAHSAVRLARAILGEL